MQIRNRDGKIALLRAAYDPKDKRTRQVSLGTFKADDVKTFDQVPKEIREQLAEAEAGQLFDFLRTEAEAAAQKELEEELDGAGKTLEAVAVALESDKETTVENLRAALAAIDRITKAIKKRGLKKKDLRPPKTPCVPKGQTSIFEALDEMNESGHVRLDESGHKPDAGGVL